MKRFCTFVLICYIGVFNLLAQSATPLDVQKGSRLKYFFSTTTAAGSEEFTCQLVLTEVPAIYAEGDMEFFYETSALNYQEGKLLMKKKALKKGKWDEERFYGGEKTLKHSTMFWLSRRQAANLFEGGEFRWGKNGKIRYEKKGEEFITLQVNNTTKTFPVIKAAWTQNSKYEIWILNSYNNPLIVFKEFLDPNGIPCKFYLTDWIQQEKEMIRQNAGTSKSEKKETKSAAKKFKKQTKKNSKIKKNTKGSELFMK